MLHLLDKLFGKFEMLKSIGIGSELFHKLIENNCYYVDKTAFIRTVFDENKADVMLITRPRRFGKTLTMSMFYDFLSLNIENPGDVSCHERWPFFCRYSLSVIPSMSSITIYSISSALETS